MDAILYWNAVANEANREAHTTIYPSEAGSRGPCGSSRAYAIVHLAMHDAYFGIHPAPHGRYLTGLPVPTAGADADAAIAAAAHATLTALYPAQKPFFDERHRAAGLVAGVAGSDGHTYGATVAAAMLALRKGDPGTGDDGYASSVQPGHHRHDPDAPPAEQTYYAPFYGAASKCFATTTRFRLDAPYALGSPEYLANIAELRGKGIAPELAGTLPVDAVTKLPVYETRTASETLTGIYWAYDGTERLGTPPRLYNRIVRKVAMSQGNSLEANARLFALVNAAMADAAILAWDDKYYWDLWRPVVAIREHDASTGPAAASGHDLIEHADPGWLPLGSPRSNQIGRKNFTPNFPAYPSGHATFGAAAFQSVRRFYDATVVNGRDDLADGLSFLSEELDGNTSDNHGTVRPRHERTFADGLWQMIDENGRSRVYLGVHWMFDAFATDAAGQMDLTQNIGGVRLGLDLADDIAAHGLSAAAGAPPAPRP